MSTSHKNNIRTLSLQPLENRHMMTGNVFSIMAGTPPVVSDSVRSLAWKPARNNRQRRRSYRVDCGYYDGRIWASDDTANAISISTYGKQRQIIFGVFSLCYRACIQFFAILPTNMATLWNSARREIDETAEKEPPEWNSLRAFRKEETKDSKHSKKLGTGSPGTTSNAFRYSY